MSRIYDTPTPPYVHSIFFHLLPRLALENMVFAPFSSSVTVIVYFCYPYRMNKEETFYGEKAFCRSYHRFANSVPYLREFIGKNVQLRKKVTYQRTEVKVEVLFCKGRIH